ncbi:hypothetical protein MTBLM5_30225 [Magnetospirillum sp. LM-5]|nr:hypothetical protein MTBLM5_30225 [Magnetospirillum sp. LM-5]
MPHLMMLLAFLAIATLTTCVGLMVG